MMAESCRDLRETGFSGRVIHMLAPMTARKARSQEESMNTKLNN